jgi:hypothetical protein
MLRGFPFGMALLFLVRDVDHSQLLVGSKQKRYEKLAHVRAPWYYLGPLGWMATTYPN